MASASGEKGEICLLASITVTTEPIIDPQTHTPTFYLQLAAELMAALDTIATIMPKLEEAEAAEAKQARRNLNVSDAFCVSAIVAVEQLPELDAAKRLNVEKSRNRLQFLEAFRPVDDKLDAISRRLKHALRANKSALGTDALLIYRMARAQASDDRSPAISGLVAALKRDLGRKMPTKAEREERKAQRLRTAVEQALGQSPQKEVNGG